MKSFLKWWCSGRGKLVFTSWQISIGKFKYSQSLIKVGDNSSEKKAISEQRARASERGENNWFSATVWFPLYFWWGAVEVQRCALSSRRKAAGDKGMSGPWPCLIRVCWGGENVSTRTGVHACGHSSSSSDFYHPPLSVLHSLPPCHTLTLFSSFMQRQAIRDTDSALWHAW